jgi:AAA+ ATPase superfamily predicted ATPase
MFYYSQKKGLLDMGIFIGRKPELRLIQELLHQSTAKILVINGRRRVGKSTLMEKATENFNVFGFSGLAPGNKVTEKDQINNFLSLLSKKTGKIPKKCANWFDAFQELSRAIPPNVKSVILFDEISWMGHGDDNFVQKLKVWWDTDISKRNILLIFCGSVSTWIEKNIINSTAFYGRIAAVIQLQQLSIPESAEFLKKIKFQGSAFEFYKILSVTGGVPWYLEQINPALTADQNIENLCFKRSGLLNSDFEKIFNDVFARYGNVYNKILEILADGMKTLAEIRAAINYSHGGTLSELTDNLAVCGFIRKHRQWSFKTKKQKKQSIYGICDPYIRFYLKYIKPNGGREKLPDGFDSMIGLQIESLLVQNRQMILKTLGLEDPLTDNPYVQRPTLSKKGCQIDYLIQTKTNNLYICEFKSGKNILGPEIIGEVQEKIKRLTIPRGMATIPVLFQMGGVSPSVYKSNFFYKIIELADLLEE